MHPQLENQTVDLLQLRKYDFNLLSLDPLISSHVKKVLLTLILNLQYLQHRIIIIIRKQEYTMVN